MPVSNEPPKIDNGGENPDNFSHWDIYNAFNPLAPSQKAGDSAEAYQKMATRWSNAASFFGARILQSSSAAWEGNAAEASRTAITNYVQRAEELTDAITALHQQTTTAIDGVT